MLWLIIPVIIAWVVIWAANAVSKVISDMETREIEALKDYDE